MKTTFPFCPWARSCLLLFIFATLPISDALCESPLRRALGAIKGRVDHALNKIGIGRDREPARPREEQNEGATKGGDPRYTPTPMTDNLTPVPPARLRPSSKPADFSGNVSENEDPLVVIKPSTKTRSKQQPPAVSAVAPATSKKRQQTDDPKTPAIKPAEGSSPKSNTATSSLQSTTEPDAPPVVPPAKVGYAKPVPGKRGFVYAPGVTEEMKNILDVRGATPGQKMRDPRTGQMFLVP